MNILQKMILRRAVRFVRSPRGRRLAVSTRHRVDTPANQARAAEAVRRLRAAGPSPR